MSNRRGSREQLPDEVSSNGNEPDRGESNGDLVPGDVVGEYVVIRRLGEGGFGTVYEAMHPVIGKRAAVKVLHATYSADESMTSRFVAEARAVNQIRHKNIVDIFSFGDLSDGRHYYVMELLEGVPLDAYLEKRGRLPVEEALPILHAIAKALSAAHEAGIAHRDLKPENVILELDSDGFVHPKLLDFGMAKLLKSGAMQIHKTRSGAPIGSPRYMSPEQCRGVEVDSRTDVYAFGCMAYRMLAGVTPFDASTALELMMAHVSSPPSPPSSHTPELSPLFDEPILRMLEKQPDSRPQTLLLAYATLREAATKQGRSNRRLAHHPRHDISRNGGGAAVCRRSRKSAAQTAKPGTQHQSREPLATSRVCWFCPRGDGDVRSPLDAATTIQRRACRVRSAPLGGPVGVRGGAFELRRAKGDAEHRNAHRSRGRREPTGARRGLSRPNLAREDPRSLRTAAS
ncbi:MAG: serine/threonine-protein kinase [Polyangiaceae bacterium]